MRVLGRTAAMTSYAFHVVLNSPKNMQRLRVNVFLSYVERTSETSICHRWQENRKIDRDLRTFVPLLLPPSFFTCSLPHSLIHSELFCVATIPR